VITAESRKHKDKTEEKTDLVTDKIRLLDEINDIQTAVNPAIDKEIATLKTDINTIQLTDIPTMTGVLPGQQTIMEQPKENLELNKVETLKANNVNRPIIKRYEDAFNTLDRNHYTVTQEPNESDDEYLKRIQSPETLHTNKYFSLKISVRFLKISGFDAAPIVRAIRDGWKTINGDARPWRAREGGP
jgi:hypothetical protein